MVIADEDKDTDDTGRQGSGQGAAAVTEAEGRRSLVDHEAE